MGAETDDYPITVVGRWPYYLSKIYEEKLALEYCRKHQLPLVVLNPSLLMGPGDERLSSTWTVVKFLNGDIPALPTGGMSFVDVRDAADAFVQALTRGELYGRHLMGVNMSMSDFFERLSRLSGVPLPRLRLPKQGNILGAKLLERWAKLRGTSRGARPPGGGDRRALLLPGRLQGRARSWAFAREIPKRPSATPCSTSTRRWRPGTSPAPRAASRTCARGPERCTRTPLPLAAGQGEGAWRSSCTKVPHASHVTPPLARRLPPLLRAGLPVRAEPAAHLDGRLHRGAPAGAGPFSVVQWHAHEMFFGFGWAVMGGFLLTSTKNWVHIRGYHGARAGVPHGRLAVRARRDVVRGPLAAPAVPALAPASSWRSIVAMLLLDAAAPPRRSDTFRGQRLLPGGPAGLPRREAPAAEPGALPARRER